MENKEMRIVKGYEPYAKLILTGGSYLDVYSIVKNDDGERGYCIEYRGIDEDYMVQRFAWSYEDMCDILFSYMEPQDAG